MLIEGKVTLKSPIQKLWDSLFDIKILSSCIPGMESAEQTGDNVYDGIIKFKVGPFTLNVKATIILIEIDQPKHIKGTIKGEALGKMGTVAGEIIIDLTELQKDEVELSYSMNVTLVGKMSAIGDKLMRSKAKSMEKEMTQNFQEKLIS